MTRETDFARIKRAVENEKTKKMQAEARTESLQDEKKRLLDEASTLAKQPFTSGEEIETYVTEMRASIEKDIAEMSAILKEEGVAF